MMTLIELVKKLISFRTVTGNEEAVNACLEFIKDYITPYGTQVEICKHKDASPVIFAANTKDENFDVLILGHLDVVPAKDEMFSPKEENGKIYARGALDMKSFAAVAINSLEYVLKKNLPLKFGFILSTDEEQGSKSLDAFLKNHPNLKSKIVLDNDVGGDITKIIARCKNPVFVKLRAQGKAAHGSTPWEGTDANEKLFKTWQNIRKIYPYFSLETPKPENTWIDTVHFATITGGKVSNIISDYAEALLDFRLTEKSTLADLKKNLELCLEKGVSYEIVMSSIPVVVDEKNDILLSYKKLAERALSQKVNFEYIGGATDSRTLYERGSLIIMHSGTGDGMHADNEYVEIESIKQIADIQIKFLDKLAENK